MRYNKVHNEAMEYKSFVPDGKNTRPMIFRYGTLLKKLNNLKLKVLKNVVWSELLCQDIYDNNNLTQLWYDGWFTIKIESGNFIIKVLVV